MPVVMINYARSGGTVLARCLGCLSSVVLVSEVNPIQSVPPGLAGQAENWHHIHLNTKGFFQQVRELESRCHALNRKLLIRDWSWIQFNPTSAATRPVDRLAILDGLDENRIHCTAFAFVRNAVDVWLSLRLLHGIGIQAFAARYGKYAQALMKRNIKLFKYEYFCRRPEAALREICDFTGIEFDENWKKFGKFNKITGDINMQFSRGRNLDKVVSLPRRSFPDSPKFGNTGMGELTKINQMLGYQEETDEL